MEQILTKIIPSELDEFPKLISDSAPYYFSRWDRESNTGDLILRYWFWDKSKTRKNYKRVFVIEISQLITKALANGYITRGDFKIYCPKTNGAGECGFAVIIAILDFWGLVESQGRGVYRILDERKLHEFLKNKI